MVFCLCLFVFLVDESLGVQKLLIDVSEMFFKNFFPLKISFELFVDFFDDSSLFLDELIEFFVFVIGELGNVILVI